MQELNLMRDKNDCFMSEVFTDAVLVEPLSYMGIYCREWIV